MKIRGNAVGTTMAPQKIAERIGGTGGGIAPLYVTIDPDTDLASEPSQRIQEHIRNGGDVFLRAGLTEAALTHSDGGTLFFTEISAEESYVKQFIVYEDGTYEGFSKTIPSQGEVNGKITAPVTAKVGQTVVVKSVDSNGKPTKWEAADLPKDGKYELIETIKLTEDTAYIERTQEPDGTSYAFRAVFIKVKLAVGSASGSLRADFNGDQIISGGTQLSASSQMYTKISAEIKYGKFFADIENGIESEYHTAIRYSQRFANSMVSFSDIHSLKLFFIGNVINIPAGSQFEIWAVRK